MNRNLLAATDGSPNAHKALEYLAWLYRDVSNVGITLLTVAAPLSPYLSQGAGSAMAEIKRLKRLEELHDSRTRECESILDKAEGVLMRNGFPKERIHRKQILESHNTVQDILNQTIKDKFDALVLGRRGLGQVASYFMGSVSQGLIQQAAGIPVWLVDDPVVSKRVLIAVDACESCIQTLDHASFALSGCTDVEVVILHVIQRFRPFLSAEDNVSFEDIETLIEKHSEENIRKLLSDCQMIFSEADFSPSAVKIKIKKGLTGIAHEILSEYKKGGYGTLVLGRRGTGGWESVFPGSVSSKVINSHSSGAVWVVA